MLVRFWVMWLPEHKERFRTMWYPMSLDKSITQKDWRSVARDVNWSCDFAQLWSISAHFMSARNYKLEPLIVHHMRKTCIRLELWGIFISAFYFPVAVMVLNAAPCFWFCADSINLGSHSENNHVNMPFSMWLYFEKALGNVGDDAPRKFILRVLLIGGWK